MIISWMKSSRSFNLNYYSKNNRARERKNINSLYELLPNHNMATTGSQSFRMTINLNKTNLAKQEDIFKHLYQKQSKSDLNSLHQSQRQEILSYYLKNSKSSSRFMMNPTSSKASQDISSQYNQISVISHQKQMRPCKTAKEMFNNRLQNDDQDDEQAMVQSLFEDQEEQNINSVVVERISFNTKRAVDQNQELSTIQGLQIEPDGRRFILLQPLDPESECQQPIQSRISLQKITELQQPDKHTVFNSQYDQQDFDYLADSPIERIQRYSVQSQCQEDTPIKQEQKHEKPLSLQEMLLNINKSNESICENERQTIILAPKELQLEKNTIVQEISVTTSKKVNFKAMMNKHKPPQDEINKTNQFPFRNQRNKKLLLNFFDQN